MTRATFRHLVYRKRRKHGADTDLQALIGLDVHQAQITACATDSGIRLGVVVSDIHGKSARAMVKALIAAKPIHEVLDLASRRLKATREELFDALQGELTDSHRFVIAEIMDHIEELEARIGRFDIRLLDGLADERNTLALLQTSLGLT